jgi:NADH dehydrogenase
VNLSKKAAIAGAAIGGAIAARKIWRNERLRNANRAIPGNQKVVILGAGFGGMSVARELAALLPREELGDITLVDRNNYLLFTPMLTEVAGGELDPRHIVASPRRLSPRIDFQQALVDHIDVAQKTVTLGDPGGGAKRTIHADHIVIALGSVPNYHQIPGAEEHSLGIKNLAQAAAIRNRVLACLERAHREENEDARRALLTFVVGGGGYTGVEIMAAINDLARTAVKQYPNIRPTDIRSIIIEPRERLMKELSPDLAAFGEKKLRERGVEVMLNTKITRAMEDHVEIENGSTIRARTLVWAGGITPNPLIAKLDCPRGSHGGITVGECCAVAGHPGIWALGDCAEIPKDHSEGTHAPTAQNATREGSLVARNIVAVMRGAKPQPFEYHPIGELALVGRHSGVAKLYGRHFSGFVAWAMWRAIYLSKMPGVAQRSRIAVDWLLDLAFGRNVAEFPVDDSVVSRHAPQPAQKPA